MNEHNRHILCCLLSTLFLLFILAVAILYSIWYILTIECLKLMSTYCINVIIKITSHYALRNFSFYKKKGNKKLNRIKRRFSVK